jgi:hypothetical protein
MIKQFIRSAARPRPEERLSWLDRTLRGIGAILFIWYGLFKK